MSPARSGYRKMEMSVCIRVIAAVSTGAFLNGCAFKLSKGGENLASELECKPVKCVGNSQFLPSNRSSDCAPNYRCIPDQYPGAGTCTPACILSSECPEGAACMDESVCIGADIEPACEAKPIKCDPATADKGESPLCPRDYRCIANGYPGAGFCSPSCTENTDCLSGEICTDWHFCTPGF